MQQPDGGAALRAKIVAVGTELVDGDTLDTNSAWLAARLIELGIAVRGHATVGDDEQELVAALRTATVGSDVVVVTGGLGATHDAVTRVAVARLAGVALERRDASAGDRSGRTNSADVVASALPAGAEMIDAAGAVPGFVLRVAGVLLLCLPGLPVELRQMTEHRVLPLLRRHAGSAATVSRTVHTAGLAESDVAERCADLADRLSDADNPRLSFLTSHGATRLRVTGRARDVARARALTDPVVAEVVDLLGPAVVGLDDQGIEAVVARQLRRRGWTLAVAESITGGGVGARLVTVPGASEWFAGGVIAYATAAKTRLAAVPDRVLAEHGPVSEETAVALATGVRNRLDADAALAVVGLAGPTTQGQRRVGTVCLAAVVPPAVVRTRTVQLPPQSRQDLQQSGATAALDHLRRCLAAVRAT